MTLGRRDVLRVGLGGLAGGFLFGTANERPARGTPDGMHPRLAWVPSSLAPAFSVPVSSQPTSQRMFPTLLPVGDLITGALDRWYLWLWTHDATRVYLYTAPQATGPFTSRGGTRLPRPDRLPPLARKPGELEFSNLAQGRSSLPKRCREHGGDAKCRLRSSWGHQHREGPHDAGTVRCAGRVEPVGVRVGSLDPRGNATERLSASGRQTGPVSGEQRRGVVVPTP